MPGTLCPDILVIEEHFPPSASTVRAIIAAGFNFRSVAPHGDNDLWFMKMLPADHIGPERVVTLHLVDKVNPAGRVILRVRDTCNSDPASFEEYKVHENGTVISREKVRHYGSIHVPPFFWTGDEACGKKRHVLRV